MHPRNRHQGNYDLEKLSTSTPALAAKLVKKDDGYTIDFADPEAVRLLNQALLKYHYSIDYWDIPDGYLCPAIPSRVDYIHHIADLIALDGEIPRGKKITLLDIGTGANVIYPLVAHRSYGWRCIASDIDPIAVKCAKSIIDVNDLKKLIDIRLQPNKTEYFYNVLRDKEYITVVACNPPFYESEEQFKENNQRKNKALNAQNEDLQNFSGAAHELWVEGGELQFIKGLIEESSRMPKKIKWTTTLVSKAAHIDHLIQLLEYKKAVEHKVIPMTHGNKQTRVLAWRFA